MWKCLGNGTTISECVNRVFDVAIGQRKTFVVHTGGNVPRTVKVGKYCNYVGFVVLAVDDPIYFALPAFGDLLKEHREATTIELLLDHIGTFRLMY